MNARLKLWPIQFRFIVFCENRTILFIKLNFFFAPKKCRLISGKKHGVSKRLCWQSASVRIVSSCSTMMDPRKFFGILLLSFSFKDGATVGFEEQRDLSFKINAVYRGPRVRSDKFVYLKNKILRSFRW